MPHFSDAPIAGAGIGLRTKHYQDILGEKPPHLEEILDNKPRLRWLEVLSDNYLGAGGQPLYYLERVRESYPITLHGVGMSLGSTDPLNVDYLARLKSLAKRFEPAWVSDHLAWISVDARYVHDLLPLPYTEEALEHVAERVLRVQEYLGREILIENPSTYLTFNSSQMTEWEFIAALVEKTDCRLLVDVNNMYVSATNHGFDALAYLHAIPGDRVTEIHLAGYEEHGDYLFDTHGYRVRPPVWELYKAALEHLGPVPTLIEWDSDIPPFSVLLEEAAKAQAQIDRIREAA